LSWGERLLDDGQLLLDNGLCKGASVTARPAAAAAAAAVEQFEQAAEGTVSTGCAMPPAQASADGDGNLDLVSFRSS
jgi:hypothetical protein